MTDRTVLIVVTEEQQEWLAHELTAIPESPSEYDTPDWQILRAVYDALPAESDNQ